MLVGIVGLKKTKEKKGEAILHKKELEDARRPRRSMDPLLDPINMLKGLGVGECRNLFWPVVGQFSFHSSHKPIRPHKVQVF